MDIMFKYESCCKGSKLSKVVEDAVQKRKEDATLRLARIANGKDPRYKNGGRCASK